MERLKVTLTMLIVNSKKAAQLVEQLPPELGAAEPACGSEGSISVGALSDWLDAHVFERTKDGLPRQTPPSRSRHVGTRSTVSHRHLSLVGQQRRHWVCSATARIGKQE